MTHPTPLAADVIVIGDEVESILTAISAARAGARVGLLRRSDGLLGGLSTRGGLSYMDITPEYLGPLFREFLEAAGVVRVALNPDQAHQVLQSMLETENIWVHSGVMVSGVQEHAGYYSIRLSDESIVTTAVLIDATPDADVARLCCVPFMQGLGGVLGEEQDYLGVSPVFRIAGVPVADLQAFEARLRARPDICEVLATALPWHPPELREEYVTRPTFAPPGMDYLDILNPVIGIYYHLWRHGEVASYPQAQTAIDGGNVSLLVDGSLGFNGLVSRLEGPGDVFERLLALSQGAPVPADLLAELSQFERFLREEGGLSGAKVIPPQEMYVRQTLTLLAQDNMTAEKAIRGGVPPERAIGTFSYWLDLRGTQIWRKYPGEHLPKPVFNVGLEVALPCVPRLDNFAFVSRSAGYSPIGQGAGRIVQHNAMLGEAVGVAAALAVLGQSTLGEVVASGLPQVQTILAHRHGRDLQIEGRPTWDDAQIAQSRLLADDNHVMARLREQAAATLPLL